MGEGTCLADTFRVTSPVLLLSGRDERDSGQERLHCRVLPIVHSRKQRCQIHRRCHLRAQTWLPSSSMHWIILCQSPIGRHLNKCTTYRSASTGLRHTPLESAFFPANAYQLRTRILLGKVDVSQCSGQWLQERILLACIGRQEIHPLPYGASLPGHQRRECVHTSYIADSCRHV